MLGLFSLPEDAAPPETVAAIDLGSNSFHMIVARIDNGRIQVVDRLREMVRLAAGLDEHRNLDREARERALGCLERFGQRLRGMPPASVRAVGTNTLRSAKNARDFLHQAEGALGYPIEIIAGREEARLIYQGVARSLSDREEMRLVMDIGGGSTEFILGRKLAPVRRESLFMGCVTMSRTYFDNGKIKEKNLRRAEIAARLELQAIAEEYREIGWDRAVGASGTMLSIAKVLRAQGWSDQGITSAGLQQLREAVLSAGDITKLKLAELKEERLPVFPGGLAIVCGTFEELGIQTMSISDSALREGLIYDLMGRIAHEDIRDQAIHNLVRRYQIDRHQAERVEKTALMCLNQVEKVWQLESEEHQHMLAWAARLHELGLAIAHNQYHKHGAYIVANSDLEGFSREEQTLLATLVRGHRRKLPPLGEFNSLPEAEIPMAIRLCVLLRLAALLHRAQSQAAIPRFVLEADDNKLHIIFQEGWLAEHPLTQADLENERNYLKDAKIELNFQ